MSPHYHRVHHESLNFHLVTFCTLTCAKEILDREPSRDSARQ
jgi:hypothetical protein